MLCINTRLYRFMCIPRLFAFSIFYVLSKSKGANVTRGQKTFCIVYESKTLHYASFREFSS